MSSLDPSQIFGILHSVLHLGLETDEDRVHECQAWVKQNWSMIRKVTTQDERRVLGAYMQFVDRHPGSIPSRTDLDQLIREKPQNQGLVDLMTEYDRYAPDLEESPVSSLNILLDQRKIDYEKERLCHEADMMKLIATGSWTDPKNKKQYAGPSGALKYLTLKMREGLLVDHQPVEGGDLVSKGFDSLLARHEIACEGRQEQIMTGYAPLDDAFSIGHSRGNQIKYLGIAGFTGHGKSTMLFNLVYRAALQGNRVLLVPRECSVEQAWDRLAFLHAAQIGRAHELPPMKKFLRPGYARKEHRPVLEALRADMAAQKIRIDVEGWDTWDQVEVAVDAHVDDPYDVLAIDYIAHLDSPDGTNPKDRHTVVLDFFRKAQKLSQNYEGRRGLVVLSPMQTNKAGEKEIGSGLPMDKGVYRSVNSLEMYTDAGRGMDGLIGYWSADELKDNYLCKISCIKSRDAMFQPFFLRLDPHTETLNYVSDAQALSIFAQSGVDLNPKSKRDDEGQQRKRKTGARQKHTTEQQIEDVEAF